MGSPLRPRRSGKIGKQRCAYLWAALEAIAGEEIHEGTEAIEVGAIADHPPLLLSRREPCADERGKMCRHGVVGHRAEARHVARRDALRMCLHQAPEGGK